MEDEDEDRTPSDGWVLKGPPVDLPHWGDT